MPHLEIEFEREGSTVVISGRSEGANFVLTLPLDGAAAFAAAAIRAVEESTSEGRSRFILSRARLEVSK
jgi:poly(3-hydroxybutyrate) depolymerase